jgi:hypothetical protein
MPAAVPDAYAVHAEAFVRAFVLEAKRARYLDLVRTGRLRARASKGAGGPSRHCMLLVTRDLDLDAKRRLFEWGDTATDIAAALRDHGASSTGFAICGDRGAIERELPLDELIEWADAERGMDWAISFVPGRLAFTADHEGLRSMWFR